MSIFEEWPHNWWGFCKASEADPIQVPLFTEVIDPTWNPPDLAAIIEYLKSCPVAIVTSMKPVKCPLCEEFLTEPSAQRSDGVWVWPDSLAHFVSRHQVRLPDRLVERIRSRSM